MSKLEAEPGTDLFERDSLIARRIVGWFDVLCKLRRAADTVPAGDLIESLKQADLEEIESDYHWLLIILRERFCLGQDLLDKLGQLEGARYKTPSKIDDDDYDELAPTAKNDKHLASLLGVHPSTLSRYKKERKIS